MTTDVRRSAPDRFEISLDGTPVGFTQFVEVAGKRVFFHTEVEPGHEGQGLAGTLVRQALETTQAEGLRVVAVCPFVKKYVQTHPEWSDLVDPVTPDVLRALPGR